MVQQLAIKLEMICFVPDHTDTYIIFSNRHEIRRVDPFNKQTVSLVSGLQNTIALDYCYKKRWIFWTDVVDDKIWRGTMISNCNFFYFFFICYMVSKECV